MERVATGAAVNERVPLSSDPSVMVDSGARLWSD